MASNRRDWRGKGMKCRNCGKELKAEPAITEPGWVIFHECIFKGATEKEVIKNFAREKEPTEEIGEVKE